MYAPIGGFVLSDIRDATVVASVASSFFQARPSSRTFSWQPGDRPARVSLFADDGRETRLLLFGNSHLKVIGDDDINLAYEFDTEAFLTDTLRDHVNVLVDRAELGSVRFSIFRESDAAPLRVVGEVRVLLAVYGAASTRYLVFAVGTPTTLVVRSDLLGGKGWITDSVRGRIIAFFDEEHLETVASDGFRPDWADPSRGTALATLHLDP